MRYMLLILIILLAGCMVQPRQITASAHPKPVMTWSQRLIGLRHIVAWDIQGAIAMRRGEQGGRANVRWWQSAGEHFQLRLWGPLGSAAVKISGTPSHVMLQTKDGVKRSGNAQKLLDESLGWHFPIQYLYYWLRGMPVPHITSEQLFDNRQRLDSLEQAGWSIQYMNYKTVKNYELPTKLTLEHAKTQIRIVIRRWTLA